MPCTTKEIIRSIPLGMLTRGMYRTCFKNYVFFSPKCFKIPACKNRRKHAIGKMIHYCNKLDLVSNVRFLKDEQKLCKVNLIYATFTRLPETEQWQG